MPNLLKETIERLADHKRSPSDVLWVGNADEYAMSWDEFAAIASVKYHSGYGAAEVAPDLLVVGEDWWLERGEYDGSEWWEYKQLPARPENPKPFSRAVGTLWDKLHELNNLTED